MLNTEFDANTGNKTDYYPAALRAKIDAINERIYSDVNNGVYRCGFAKSQTAYEEAYDSLFNTLDYLEQQLSRQRYLAGSQITEADWRLSPTLVRFDVAYYSLLQVQPKAYRRLSQPVELYARALSNAGRRRHCEAALLHHQLLFDRQAKPNRNHSERYTGRSGANSRSSAASGMNGSEAKLCHSINSFTGTRRGDRM